MHSDHSAPAPAIVGLIRITKRTDCKIYPQKNLLGLMEVIAMMRLIQGIINYEGYKGDEGF